MEKENTTTKGELFTPGNKFHIDIEFEGERLVDDVTVLEEPKKGKVLVESPRLKANILVPAKELKALPKEELFTPGEWKLAKPFKDNSGNTYYDIRSKTTPCDKCGHDNGEYLVSRTFKNAVAKGEAKANARLLVESKNMYKALKEARALLAEMSDKYCRNANGYLKPNALWDAELDLNIQAIINRINNKS